MNVGLAVAMTFAVSLACALAFWLAIRIGRHVVDQVWDAIKSGKL